MSALLQAVSGLPNAFEPLPGLITGGQPQPHHVAALQRAGCQVVIDCREAMEPRPVREPEDIVAAGMEYVAIPVGHTVVADETFARIREAVKAVVGKRPALFHCASGNRVGATLLPYLILDRGFSEEDAVTAAMQIGMRSAGLMESALEYTSRQQPGGGTG